MSAIGTKLLLAGNSKLAATVGKNQLQLHSKLNAINQWGRVLLRDESPMKRLLTKRNKARQSRALSSFRSPTKPVLFRLIGPWPKVEVDNFSVCRRRQKRMDQKSAALGVTPEMVTAFLQGQPSEQLMPGKQIA